MLISGAEKLKRMRDGRVVFIGSQRMTTSQSIRLSRAALRQSLTSTTRRLLPSTQPISPTRRTAQPIRFGGRGQPRGKICPVACAAARPWRI